jgi:hypothetical protein
MALIHARKRAGETVFRMWGTVSDRYLTNEMTEKELRAYLLEEAVVNAFREHLRLVDNRIDQTIKNGTSSMLEDSVSLDEPWEEERKQ